MPSQQEVLLHLHLHLRQRPRQRHTLADKVSRGTYEMGPSLMASVRNHFRLGRERRSIFCNFVCSEKTNMNDSK